MRRRGSINDQRLTIYLPEGAVGGRVQRFTETGVVALMEAEVPRDGWFRFTLQLQGSVVAGEIASLGQEDRECRLQFAGLTPPDRARLEPFLEPEG